MERIITKIETKQDMVLLATFADGEIVRFEVKTMIEKHPVFKQLEDEKLFAQVRIDGVGYGISWNDDIDLSGEGIYLHGEHIGKTDPDAKILFGQAVVNRREELELSQRELSRRSGIIQSEICKIEQGKGNPTLSTMLRLSKALEKPLASLLP